MFRASLAPPQEAVHEHSFGWCSVLQIIIKSTYLMYIVMLTCAMAHAMVLKGVGLRGLFIHWGLIREPD
jgi:hypothetical protein